MSTTFFSRLLDLVSPRTCVVCGRRLSPTERDVCAPCLLHLPYTYYWQSPLDNPMARLYWGIVPVERVAALFFFEHGSDVAQTVYDLKYHDQPELGVSLGRLMASRLLPSGFFDGIDALLPMPLAPRRQRQRGYNQSLMLVQGISELTGLPLCRDLVVRRHFRASQTKLGVWERRDNVDGAFAVTGPKALERWRGRHLLLVDDIVTTGSTSQALIKALQEAGLPMRLSVLSLGLAKS